MFGFLKLLEHIERERLDIIIAWPTSGDLIVVKENIIRCPLNTATLSEALTGKIEWLTDMFLLVIASVLGRRDMWRVLVNLLKTKSYCTNTKINITTAPVACYAVQSHR